MNSAPALTRYIAGKSIAIVGNARSLSSLCLGSEIDSCEVVIRLNAAPIHTVTSHGERTTWVASSIPLSPRRLKVLEPERLIWMSPRRRALAFAAYAWWLPMSFYPYEWWRVLAARLGGARPSTGAMIIDFIASMGGFSELHLFGFDFFQSLSLSQRGLSSPPPHDFSRERQHVLELLRAEPRIKLVGGSTGCN